MAIASSTLYLTAFVGSIAALLFAFFLAVRVLKQDSGTEAMRKISSAIREGAVAYLNRQYRTIAVISIVLALVIAFGLRSFMANSYLVAVAFILGAFLSALAGYIGMMVSVRANVRTAQAATRSLKDAFSVAFSGGAVTGFAVAGLGLLGVTVLLLILKDPNILIGFGFGASLISLFARVGGGIYTKGADVGADLVGKVEKGIPEDDPRNPAVIADNVGDNVGDCAGMAADLFESYTVTIIAAMLLAWTAFGHSFTNELAFPLVLGSVAVIASLVGSLFVRASSPARIWPALNNGILISAALSAVGFFAVNKLMFSDLKYFIAAVIGLAITVIIGYVTEYYTAANKKPVQQVADSAKTGPATVIILGIAKGMESTLIPVIAIVAGAFLAYTFGGGFYGVAIAATAMLAMTAIIVAVDAYGPITDNAGGIAEMSKMPESVRKITDPLDAVGNTTKAVTKGFAIGSAGLAALSLFAAYSDLTGIDVINLYDPAVVVGLFAGGLLPFIFSSLTMRAVGRAATGMVVEVRRQFKEIPGLMKGTGKPDYARCVDISTKSAIRELILPGVIAVAAPLIVGFVLGPEALGGLLGGAIVTGLLLAITMTTSGAAWDNAKKYIEAGNLGGKGSDAHKAAVVGDTVGDPFKDTSGPALNPLIKVLNTIALLAASLIVSHHLF
ncbi:sodium-translocating pyrophosphatase [Candidatus Woesearchaeota archaeon]|nr:sodium-translocating pyrophosphatase [Candidatus Woesearchaeota archaeon]